MDVKPHHRPGQLQYSPWTGLNHTSTLDWCEDNYIETRYIAETWNAWSNIPFLLLSVYAIKTTYGLPFRPRYILLHALTGMIGVGSFVFHATLNWHAQVLLDELPMIYAATQSLYCVIARGKPTTAAVKLGCTFIPLFITATYLLFPNPIYHQAAYAVIVLTGFWKQYDLGRKTLHRQSPLRKDALYNMKSGAVLMATAFAIWNLDNLFCEAITVWRARVPYWVGVFSQGHAWWHIIIALGTSRVMTALAGIAVSSQDPNIGEFGWALGFIPYFQVRTKRE